MKRHIAVTVAELHYQGIHAGYLQLPVYRLDGGYVRMLTIHEHVPASGPALRREFELADTEYVDKPLITGVCQHTVEEVTAVTFAQGDNYLVAEARVGAPGGSGRIGLMHTRGKTRAVGAGSFAFRPPRDYLAPPTEPADLRDTVIQEQGVQLRALRLYQLLALGGWGLAVLVLALGA